MLILDQQQRGNIGVGNAILPLKNLQLMSVGDYESKMRNCLYATYPLAYKIEHLPSGDVLFQVIVKFDPPNHRAILSIEHVDPVHVYVDKVLQGTFTVEPMVTAMLIGVKKGQVIELLVSKRHFEFNAYYINGEQFSAQASNVNPLCISNQQFALPQWSPNSASFSSVPPQQETQAHFSNHCNYLERLNISGAKKSAEFYLTHYKTELCRSVWENRVCSYGFRCMYAHSKDELRTPIRHPKYKTQLCNNFHSTGFCSYGSRCHFIHSISYDGKLD
ncbi:mRNA decay activator protein ZFP36L2-B [Trichonephila clavipes]|nr:mRNA decay activator protein ZFP36L2-B [Trichonephila clavipes]